MTTVNIVGAGLAGVEAAWQLAKRGIKVKLYEMRPQKMTPAHKTGLMAELVCSNSFRSNALENAVGLLKREMEILDSLIMKVANVTAIPAGGALAVDREKFSERITELITTHENIELVNEEVSEIPQGAPTIIASGPLTSASLSKAIKDFTGEEYLHFYDAAAPIVTKESIDFSKVFWASRYGKGDGADYLNCPMTKEEYAKFYNTLVTAEMHKPKDFEREIFFEGCMPIEVMAKRGPETLLYGPLKPVGLIDPKTGEQPYAVVQLRKENESGSLFNLVGFQTSLKWGEQKKLVQLIPGLEMADIIRYGVMHRNTFIVSPKILKKTLQTKKDPSIFFAGQITGVEGYVESASSGLVAGINCAMLVTGKKPLDFPNTTAIGALCNYIVSANPESFQPMNVNFGLLPALNKKIRPKSLKKQKISERALNDLQDFIRKEQIR